jgi:Zn-dependent protease
MEKLWNEGDIIYTVTDIWRGLDWSFLTDIVLTVIPALICITFHELCHGYVAYLLGDDTAKSMGRLSLNPIRHIDVFGLLMMVVFKFGWAKPVPIDMRKFKNPKQGMAISALAGPVSNILLACVALFIYGLVYDPLNGSGGFGEAVLRMVGTTAYLSTALAIFNIIPVPPLDGSKVLFAVMSDEAYYRLMRYERYGMIILIVLVASGVLGTPLYNAVTYVYDKLFYIAELAHNLFNLFA